MPEQAEGYRATRAVEVARDNLVGKISDLIQAEIAYAADGDWPHAYSRLDATRSELSMTFEEYEAAIMRFMPKD